jgi:hypothetical protein
LTLNLKVSPADLERCRQNPASAADLRDDRVVCLECGALVMRLGRGAKSHLGYTHHMLLSEYLSIWPGAALKSKKARKADNDKRNENYAARLAAAEADPTGPDAKWIKEQHDRSSGTWMRKYWGKNGSPGTPDPNDEDAAAFRRSEIDRKLERHLKRREQDNADGRAWYEANKEREREKRRKRARKTWAIGAGRPRKRHRRRPEETRSASWSWEGTAKPHSIGGRSPQSWLESTPNVSVPLPPYDRVSIRQHQKSLVRPSRGNPRRGRCDDGKTGGN